MTISQSRTTGRLVAAVSGAVFAGAQPPLDVPFAALLGLAGLAWSLLARDGAAPRRSRAPGLLRGALFGFAANAVALRFVPEVVTRFTPLGLAPAWLALGLLAAAQAVPWALAGALAGVLRDRAGAPPVVAFALAVYAATFAPGIFPWTPAGGLATWPVLLQFAEAVGERGVSLLLAAAMASIAMGAQDLFRRDDGADRARAGARSLGVGAVMLAAMLVYGTLRMASVERARSEAAHARVALVQPQFAASDRWEADRASHMLARLTELTRRAEDEGAALTVWPESAYPYTLPHATRVQPSGTHAILQPGVHGPVLTGAYMSGNGAGFNAAILALPNGSLARPYDKQHLLWFGETVPFADTIPWVKRTFARGTGLAAGTESVLLTAGTIRAAVLNCYEDTLPAAGREAMAVAPNLLVNVTNDAWFAGSAEGELHLRLAVLRAIETRRDLVRAVNRGPTSWLDATGRVKARYDAPAPGSLATEPALLEGTPTVYARFGDVPVLGIITALSAANVARRRARR